MFQKTKSFSFLCFFSFGIQLYIYLHKTSLYIRKVQKMENLLYCFCVLVVFFSYISWKNCKYTFFFPYTINSRKTILIPFLRFFVISSRGSMTSILMSPEKKCIYIYINTVILLQVYKRKNLLVYYIEKIKKTNVRLSEMDKLLVRTSLMVLAQYHNIVFDEKRTCPDLIIC